MGQIQMIILLTLVSAAFAYYPGSGGQPSSSEEGYSSPYYNTNPVPPYAVPTKNACSGVSDGRKRPVNSVCFAYFECNNQYEQYNECNSGYRFDQASENCVPDSNCVTACPPEWRPDPNNENNFILKDKVLYCPAPTYFDYRHCTCIRRISTPASTTQPNPSGTPASTTQPNPSGTPASTTQPNPSGTPASTIRPNPSSTQPYPSPPNPTGGPYYPNPPNPTSGPNTPNPPNPTGGPYYPSQPIPTSGPYYPNPPNPTSGPNTPSPPNPTGGPYYPSQPIPTSGPYYPNPPNPTSGSSDPSQPYPESGSSSPSQPRAPQSDDPPVDYKR